MPHGPALSVILPAYNAAADIAAALDGLTRSSCQDFELFVVDDGSSDGTGELAAAHPLKPTVIRTAHAGASRARNAGAAAARAPILVFLDADVVAHPDTLARLAAAFEDPTLDGIMGSYDDQPHHPQFLSQYRNLMHSFYHQTGRPRASTFWAGCGALRRDAFFAVNGFAGNWKGIEDIELGYRLNDAGKRIALDPTIRVQHRKRWTLATMVRTDVFLRGMTWTELILRDGRMPDDLNTGTSQRISVASVAILLLALIAGLWPISLAALALILALNRRIFAFFAAKRGWWFALRTVPLFVFYLFYSGLSFALGASKFAFERANNRFRKSSTSTGLPM
ncbi:MAG: glycosyltransferase family 2 protein [Bryobacterales bacterium]|nr:glycosyltransferase family 2 protein [Bryobacterales bacterium]